MNKVDGVLVDNNILNLTKGVEYFEDITPLKIGGMALNNPRVKPYYVFADNVDKEINRLLTRKIGELAGKGNLELFSSNEIDLEAFRSSYPMEPLKYFGEMKSVNPPLERSYFQSIEIGGVFGETPEENKVKVHNFINLILQAGPQKLSKIYPEAVHINSFASFSIFKKLCLDISRRHWDDLFHLWTADVNGLRFFLTYDKKFIKAYKNSKFQFQSIPIEPGDLFRAKANIFDKLAFKKGEKFIRKNFDQWIAKKRVELDPPEFV